MTERVETPYGTLGIVPVERDRVRVEAGIPVNVTDERLVINGVPYCAQAWLYLWSDGVWHLGREDDRMSQLHEPHLSRTDRDALHNDPSRSAVERAREAIFNAVNEWAIKPEAQLALARANVNWCERELGRAEAKVIEAEDALRLAENGRGDAESALALAQDHLRSLESEPGAPGNDEPDERHDYEA